ncbi:hypothetical protein BESB_001150 [Besnoitia besnoiti]|uniref:Transmembrane protein n=1 Tax=Besnoitia besnoiti TaxID=94643 RepID=A0A2A9MP35_BESBE|nr:hypothetical protein BESB_001150 [Besnoitia besnoiti]PFH37773.1 hypothetical protein BESB_001150 [Besnoitia besnoiti]
MATDFGAAGAPLQKVEEVEDIDDPEKWFDDLNADTEFANYEAEREQRLKRTEILRNSVIVRNVRQTDQLISEFQTLMKPDTITLGVADAEDIRHRDEQAAESKFNAKQEDALRFQYQVAEFEKLEQVARERLLDRLAEKERDLVAKAEDAAIRDKERQDHLCKTLRAAEYKLQAALSVRKGELKTTYGTLAPDRAYTRFAKEQKPPEKKAAFLGKKYTVEWDRAPQPLRLRLDLCRAVKDKLPQGQYVIMASVWNRLGGHRLQWRSLQRLEERDREPTKAKSVLRQVTEMLDDGTRRAKELCGVISTSSAVSAPVSHSGLWYTDELRFDQTLYMACPPERDITPSMCLVLELYLLRGSASPVDKVVAWAAFPLVDSDFRLIRGCFKLPLIRGNVDPTVTMYAQYEKLYREDVQAWLCNLYFRCDPLAKYSAGQLEFEVLLNYTGNLLSVKKRNPQRPELTRAQLREKAEESVNELKKALHEPHDVLPDADDALMKDGIRAVKTKGMEDSVYRPLIDSADFDQFRYAVTSGHTLVRSNELRRKAKYIADELFGDFVLSSDVREIGLCAFATILLLLAFWVRIFLHAFGQALLLAAFRVPIYQFDVSYVIVYIGYVQDLLTADKEAAVVLSGPVMSFFAFVLMGVVLALAQSSFGRLPSVVYRFVPAYGLAVILDPEVTLIIDAAASNWTGDSFKLYNLYQLREGNGVVGIIFTFLLYAVFSAVALLTFYYYVTQIHRHGRVRDTHRRLTADEPDFFVPLDREVSTRYLKWVCHNAKQFRGAEGETRTIQVTDFIVDREDRAAVKRLAKLGDVATGVPDDDDGEGDFGFGGHDSKFRSFFRAKRTDATTYVCIHTINPTKGTKTLYRHFMRYSDGAICELNPKEPAKLLAERKAPETVTQVLYDAATGEARQTEEVSLGSWLRDSFGDLPPMMSAENPQKIQKSSHAPALLSSSPSAPAPNPHTPSRGASACDGGENETCAPRASFSGLHTLSREASAASRLRRRSTGAASAKSEAGLPRSEESEKSRESCERKGSSRDERGIRSRSGDSISSSRGSAATLFQRAGDAEMNPAEGEGEKDSHAGSPPENDSFFSEE